MPACKHVNMIVRSVATGQDIEPTKSTILKHNDVEYLCTPDTCKIGKENCKPEPK